LVIFAVIVFRNSFDFKGERAQPPAAKIAVAVAIHGLGLGWLVSFWKVLKGHGPLQGP